MLKQFVLSKTFFSLVTASLLAEIIVATCTFPAQAATLAFSQITTQLNNFSYRPDLTQTFTDTKTLALPSADSSSFAVAQAEADFFVEPTLAKNNILSSATGEGNSYFSSAQSEAQVIGNFTIKPSEIFSFNFITSADFLTLQDNSSKDFVNASGELSLLLFDILEPQIIYDSFLLTFEAPVSATSNYLNFQYSSNFLIEGISLSTSFTQTEDVAKNITNTLVESSFSHRFEMPTTITLKEIKKNQVAVQVPESETLLGTICFLVLIAIKYRDRIRLPV